MSSSASSWITSTTSSTVITPIRRPDPPITGADTRSYCSKTWPTSSWSVAAGIALRSVAMMSRKRSGRRGAQQPVQRNPPDRPVARVDHVDFVKIARQVVAGLAHVVDGLAHGPERRQRDQLALHQAAGAVLGMGEACRDAGPLLARDRVEDLLALRVVEVLQHGDGIVAVHVRDGFGNPAPPRSRRSAPRGFRPRPGRARRRSARHGRWR